MTAHVDNKTPDRKTVITVVATGVATMELIEGAKDDPNLALNLFEYAAALVLKHATRVTSKDWQDDAREAGWEFVQDLEGVLPCANRVTRHTH